MVDMLSAKGPTVVGQIERTINEKHTKNKKKYTNTWGQLVQYYNIVQPEIVDGTSKSHCTTPSCSDGSTSIL